MRRLAFALALVPALCLISCSLDSPLQPVATDDERAAAIDPNQVARELIAGIGWQFVDGASEKATATVDDTHVFNVQRELVLGNVFHYSFDVQVGDGPYDVIRLHRVVKETSPMTPIRTKKAIFLQHGDAVGFVKFLIGSFSPNLSPDRSFAAFLAENNVDVWGIDQDWILVPEEVTDFGFMEDWGLQRQVDNVDLAIATARFTRRLMGAGFNKMILGGYSSGVWTGYALLNQESQLPPGLRNVGGYIAFDGYYKVNDEDERLSNCALASDLTDAIAAGVYYDDSPTLFQILGQLGQLDPDSLSPVFPPFTNYQAALFLGAATWELASPPWYHFVAGEFDENGIPVDLLYSDPQVFLDFIQGAGFYEPLRFELDYAAVSCSDETLFDDYLSEISVPIFELGAAGGLGSLSAMGDFVASRDFTSVVVQLLDPDQQSTDIGHIDIWIAEDARELFWEPALDWIVDHSRGRRGTKTTMGS